MNSRTIQIPFVMLYILITISMLTYSIDFITQTVHIIIVALIFIFQAIIQYNTQGYLYGIDQLKNDKLKLENDLINSGSLLRLEKELHRDTKKNTLKTIKEIKERLENNDRE